MTEGKNQQCFKNTKPQVIEGILEIKQAKVEMKLPKSCYKYINQNTAKSRTHNAFSKVDFFLGFERKKTGNV